MALPKYLPIKKKIPYNIRMPENLLNSLNAYADLSGNTTTDVVIDVLTDFMSDKIVFNDYLADVGSKTIKIPTNPDAKNIITHEKYENGNLLNAFDGSIFDYNDYNAKIVRQTATAVIEIRKIPNNLDVFDGYSYQSDKKNRHYHKGIEFFVYTPKETDIAWEYIEYLYCFYFEVIGDETNVYLIDELDAINRLANADTTTKDLLIACIKELESIDTIIDDLETYHEDKPIDYSGAYGKFLEIAEKYNTGNIVEFGANIEKRIEINTAENKLGSDPKLIEFLLSKINALEVHERAMAETIEKLEKK